MTNRIRRRCSQRLNDSVKKMKTEKSPAVKKKSAKMKLNTKGESIKRIIKETTKAKKTNSLQTQNVGKTASNKRKRNEKSIDTGNVISEPAQQKKQKLVGKVTRSLSRKNRQGSVVQALESGSNPSSPDLYDFENSEENVTCQDEKNIKTSGKRKLGQPKVQKTHKRRALSNRTNSKTTSSYDKKPVKTILSKDSSLLSSVKRCNKSRVSFDSGVFMSPSPVSSSISKSKQSMQKFFSDKPSSTPTGSATICKSNGKLGPPLLSPPDLSPVKTMKSFNSGGEHGKVITSPTELSISYTVPPVEVTYTEIKQNYSRDEEALMDDFEPQKLLDISKSYTSFSAKKKPKKTNKKAKKYSLSRYEVWADQKASEFEEIEKYELSIENT